MCFAVQRQHCVKSRVLRLHTRFLCSAGAELRECSMLLALEVDVENQSPPIVTQHMEWTSLGFDEFECEHKKDLSQSVLFMVFLSACSSVCWRLMRVFENHRPAATSFGFCFLLILHLFTFVITGVPWRLIELFETHPPTVH